MFAALSCEYFVYSLCINVFTAVSLLLYYGQYWTSPASSFLPEYDYIIVGSGTAGSLIGHRMATQTSHSHVVLEAGPRGHPFVQVPVLGPLLQGSTYDWGYETAPQDAACLSMTGRRCKWPRGKIVGGSAILNNMIHMRGNLTQYLEWFHGRYSLSYLQRQFDYIESRILPVHDVKYNSLLADAMLEAASEIDYQIHNLNENFSLGFMKSLVNQKAGARWSTSRTLLDDKNNLATNILVDKVLVDERKVAYGVQYTENGVPRKMFARKGIVLAAGAINTPKLLLLSGIGPKEHLKQVDIEVVKELPVGKNLQDHVSTGLDLVLFNQSLNLAAYDMLNPFHALNYFVRGTGPFTSPGCEVVGTVSTKKTKSADLQFMVMPVGVTSDKGVHLKNSVGIRDDVWRKYFSKLFNKQTASILPILLHPKSKGDVTLRSKDPHDAPVINPRYLTDSNDMDVLVDGLNIIEELVNTKAMRKLGAYLNPQPFPGCENLVMFSKAYWECYVRQLTLTSFHPVGTCAMGPVSSPDSVVDTDFKVIGVDGLYVADGSVLPALPSGNVNAAIALMANIFFETHFLNNIISVVGVCHRNDMLYNIYYKMCSVNL